MNLFLGNPSLGIEICLTRSCCVSDNGCADGLSHEDSKILSSDSGHGFDTRLF